MSVFHVKHLPVGAVPEGGVMNWSAADAERWRKAGGPAVVAPVAGSRIMVVLVVVSYVLTSAFSSGSAAWHGGDASGTDWLRYPGAVLSAALPLWYRYLPAALVVAVDTAGSLSVLGPSDGRARAGHLLVLAVCAWAAAGGSLRLRSRRRQRAAALAAAGRRRFPIPDGVPESDGHRGHLAVYLGTGLCLAAAAVLAHGLAGDLTWSGPGSAYDAAGQQTAALLLLVPGTTLYGWGHLAHRAARRLHEEPQPALIVGVRAGRGGRYWLYPDARDTSARPLAACLPRGRDTRGWVRSVGHGPAYGAESGHHDVDPRAEPFEAVLYGAPAEGAEIALEYARIEHYGLGGSGTVYTSATAAVLRPDRRHGLGPWQPADAAARRRERRRLAEEERARHQEAQRARLRKEHERAARRPAPAPSPAPERDRDSGTRNSGGGCGGGSGCGGCGCG